MMKVLELEGLREGFVVMGLWEWRDGELGVCVCEGGGVCVGF